MKQASKVNVGVFGARELESANKSPEGIGALSNAPQAFIRRFAAGTYAIFAS
jgi:hypothetical protein